MMATFKAVFVMSCWLTLACFIAYCVWDGCVALAQKFHLRHKLHKVLYPTYNCEDCIGMKDHGCQCDYYGCVAPSTPPSAFRTFLRRLFRYE